MKRDLILFATMLVAASGFGRSFAIEYEDDAAPWEVNAAKELEHYLGQIVENNLFTIGGEYRLVFHVGNGEFAASKGLGSDTFKNEEWTIRTFGGDLVLNGGGTRGALYAVYHFLEDYCGVRWWSDDEEDVPKPPSLELKAINVRSRPHFAYRNVYRDINARNFKTAVRARLNANGADGGTIPGDWGGSVEYGSPKHAHTFDLYLPFDTYGKEHPEWYSLWKGRRRGGRGELGGQLCLTNPEMAAAFEQAVFKNIRDRVAAAQAAHRAPEQLYEISMNDNHIYCTCPACTREIESFGHSGYQLRFVNRIAEAAHKEFPFARFTWLAYYDAEPKPKNGVRAAANVIVKFCNTQQNQAADFLDATNRRSRGLLEPWLESADSIFIWDYATTFRQRFVRGLPYPSEFVQASKLREFDRCHVRGIFIEHEQHEYGDMWELKFYVNRKLYEDPTLDNVQLVKNFCEEYFGPKAGPIVYETRHLLKLAAEKRAAKVTWEPQLGSFNYISNKLLAKLVKNFDAAAAAVKGEEKFERRLRRARQSVDKLMSLRKTFARLNPPAPDTFDQPFYAMPVNASTTLIWAYGTDRREVVDLAAFSGKAVRLPSRKLPMAFGLHDSHDGSCERQLDAIPAETGPGYHWYPLGKAKFPNGGGYVYCDGWGVQIDFAIPQLMGKEAEIFVDVKFEENATYIDRIAFVPQAESAAK